MGIFDLESREALVGTPTVAISANPSGNVLERLAHISANLGAARLTALALGIPQPLTEPVDRTISEDMTFEDVPVHYYRNLTIADGVTVTLRNGPMIVVVEGDLTIGSGAIIDANGKGGKGGAAVSGGAHGKGGYGGNLWNVAVAKASRVYGDPHFPAGNAAVLTIYGTAASERSSAAYPLEGTVAGWICGTAGGNVISTNASGSAWNEPSLWENLSITGFDWLLYRAVVFAILSRAKYHATYGGLGGGGGGSGASSTGTSINVKGGQYYAGKGEDGNASGEPGAGGAGFGSGGSGGSNQSGTSGNTSGAGGNGGGTQLWIVKRISNAGTVRSNGENGQGTAGALAGGGGGGGGGCAALLYEQAVDAGVGTWQANAGSGGAGGGGVAYGGGNGGAGLVRTVQLVRAE